MGTQVAWQVLLGGTEILAGQSADPNMAEGFDDIVRCPRYVLHVLVSHDKDVGKVLVYHPPEGVASAKQFRLRYRPGVALRPQPLLHGTDIDLNPGAVHLGCNCGHLWK